MTADAPDGDPGGEPEEASASELAGICDLFGGLTREELARARSELAARRGRDEPDPGAVEAAIEAYALVEHDGLLVAGPTAFPSLPPAATDLPHIMDVPDRDLDRAELGEAVHGQLLDALDEGDADPHRLREASYDLEAWAPVDADDVRARIDRRESESEPERERL